MSFKYDKDFILKDINLEINTGEILSIMGPSGCGKSTLLGVIGGIDKPDKGKVLIGDTDLYALKNEELDIFRNENIGINDLFVTNHKSEILIFHILKCPHKRVFGSLQNL